MKKKSVWLLSVCLTLTITLLAACTSPGTTTPPTTNISPTGTVATTIAPSAEDTPKYGGTLSMQSFLDVGVFDPVATGSLMGSAGYLIFEQYLGADWSRGAAGTGEIDWATAISGPDSCTSILAESWQIPELGTIVLKVRQGVHWALNPGSEASRLMNGREVTADDWIANYNYRIHGRYTPSSLRAWTVEKTGPWEITLKTPVDPLTGWMYGTGSILFPPEIIQRYGNMLDWHNVVGTGPFMLTDYVAGSMATLVKNQDYWRTDPVGPGKGNRLPYLDRVKIPVIPDPSTQQAALRTGKIDVLSNLWDEDTRSLIQHDPGLKSRRYIVGTAPVIAMRTDKADLPYKDKRVRQALMLAFDYEYFLKAGCEVLVFPVTKIYGRSFMPLEEMPESAQALFRYSPERAKQLLAEAGYPDGFKARIIVPANYYGFDEVALGCKEAWAELGIDLEVQPRESGIATSIIYSRSYEDMITGLAHNAYPYHLLLYYLRGTGSWSYVNDPVIEAAYQEIQKHVIINMPEAERLFRELTPYIVEQAYYLPVPLTPLNTVWWPWLKNYHGESVEMAMYYWIDQDLKEEMTGRR